MSKVSQQASRLTLRQFSHLGLPAAVVLPSVLAVVREMTGADHAAFFYCDADGNMTNMYAERMLPPEAMAGYYQKHYRANNHAFSATYLERVAASDPISMRSVTDAERGTDYYKDVLSPLEVEHLLYAIVRTPGSRSDAVGQLSLYRSAAKKPFASAEANALRDVLHYIAVTLAAPKFDAVSSPVEQTAEEAMAVLSDRGETIFADAAWMRLVRLARGDRITPMSAHDEPRALAQFLAGVLQATSHSPNVLHRIESPWGRFVFRQHQLSGAQGNNARALLVTRLASDPVRLTEGAARLDLSPQQREVALLVALGDTNADIAEKLDVSVNTASYHVKQLFSKLNVHDRAEVAKILRRS